MVIAESTLSEIQLTSLQSLPVRSCGRKRSFTIGSERLNPAFLTAADFRREKMSALRRSRLNFFVWNYSDWSMRVSTLSKVKRASPRGSDIFRPIVLLRGILLRHDWLKMTKPRLFVADRLCHGDAFSPIEETQHQTTVCCTSFNANRVMGNPLRRSVSIVWTDRAVWLGRLSYPVQCPQSVTVPERPVFGNPRYRRGHVNASFSFGSG